MAPLFESGAIFSLIIMFDEKNGASDQSGTINLILVENGTSLQSGT